MLSLCLLNRVAFVHACLLLPDFASNYYPEDQWYKITVVVTDTLGWVVSTSIEIFKDQYYSPLLTLLDPANESTYYIPFYLEISIDADYLKDLKFYFDGVYQGIILSPMSAYHDILNFYVNVSSMTVGTHLYEFVATGYIDSDITFLRFEFSVGEMVTTTETQTMTTTPPPMSTTTIDDDTTADPTTTEDTTEPVDTTTDTTTTTTLTTISLTPGFSAFLILFVFVVLIPVKKFRKK